MIIQRYEMLIGENPFDGGPILAHVKDDNGEWVRYSDVVDALNAHLTQTPSLKELGLTPPKRDESELLSISVALQDAILDFVMTKDITPEIAMALVRFGKYCEKLRGKR